MTKAEASCAALIARAKAVADNGFSRLGGKLDLDSASQGALMLLATRAAALGNALVLLAQHSLPNEALPLLRSLLEIAAAMRWIVQENTEARARAVLEQAKEADWADLWDTKRLRARLRAAGFPPAFEDRIMMFCYDHVFGNAQGLPWGHVFESNKNPGISSEELLRMSAVASGHVIKALDVRWPGRFDGAEELWEKA